MARADDTELIDRFEEFYRSYYRNEIAELAQKYPTEQKSLYIDWRDLSRFDTDLADDFRSKPEQLQRYAEEALRLYDLPVDVSLGQAHVRVTGLPEKTGIRDIRADHRGSLLTVQGIIRKATDVRPKVTTAAFECQRCGTLSRIPQDVGDFQEPYECQGCERQGPFHINYDQSEFVDAQKIRVQESPEGLRGGETPQNIDINIEDDITGRVTAGDHVSITGVLKLEQQGSEREKSPMFDVYMNGLSVEIEDEEFDEMDITDADKKEIIELSNESDIYEQVQGAIAPSIFGYEMEKLAMALQLFSGVTKHLPDGSRTRGDLHMLLIGDPGTGKCQKYDTDVVLADGRVRKLGALVESHLTDPVEIDDGYRQRVDFGVLTTDGKTIQEGRATRVWKREAPEQMYRLRTASGTELEVTPSHPLFVQEEGTLSPVAASELSEDEFLAVPRTLPSADDNSLDINSDSGTHDFSNGFDCPETLTDELARLLGYAIGNGSLSGPSSRRVLSVTSAEDEIIEDISTLLDGLGLEHWIEEQAGDNVRTVRCVSVELVRALEAIEPAILDHPAQQRVPDVVFRASRSRKREFLRAYLGGEAHVSSQERELTVASMGESLLKGLRTVLLSFGIGSQLHPDTNEGHRLRITGADFERYVSDIGFVTDRNSTEGQLSETPSDIPTGVIPGVGQTLRRIREALVLSQSDCGLPESTYQCYERGDRNPSREHLQTVVSRFESRLDQLSELKQRIEAGDQQAVSEAGRELNLSQATLADGMALTRGGESERNDAVPDGGTVADARTGVRDRIDAALAVAGDAQSLRSLVDAEIGWDRIDSITVVEPDYEWVYDLEIAETHTYLSEGIVSHNSAMLQYIQNIAPRSVYTSGKGSSAAGLCVTGETLVHTPDGLQEIRSLVEPHIPEPVSAETAVEHELPLYTYHREDGEFDARNTSHVWRMPEKPCRRIETAHDRELEGSVNTPVLTCEADRVAWKPLTEVESGDSVAVPASEEAGTPLEGSLDGMDLSWDEVVAVVDTGQKELFDLTVPETHNFVGNGIVTHNTAAAVRDDFGDGQQWSLEAGALVLADRGIAAVDELDKMRPEDQSAMHEALEQQSISISKAGINATLKARCSLLGAANPTMGRFDRFEPIGEQIDLAPPLISRFDLIFTVTDQPNEEKDTELAEHILQTNYAGELHTHRVESNSSNYSAEEVERITDEVAPTIEPELLRKYIAFSRRNCFPTMTEEAKAKIQEFYVDLRSEGADKDAAVPVTARKLEALVRLAEASARVRLSDTVELEDAQRGVDIAHYCLKEIGMDPETGNLDADMIETGTSKSQRDRVRNLLDIVSDIEAEYDEGAPVDVVLERAEEVGISPSKAEHEIENLRQKGEIYQPKPEHLRTT